MSGWNMGVGACALSGMSLVLASSPAEGQSRFLINDRTNDRIVLAADLNGDGTIDEGTETLTYFDASNAAGTLAIASPTALGVSPLGWVLMGDQSNRCIYLLRDTNGDGTAQRAAKSVVFADMDNASMMSVAFPTGAAFDSHGRMYVANAGNSFGPDAIYRLTNLNGDGRAMDAGEITEYVGVPAFGPGNGPFVPYQIVFDADDVLYLRNTGASSQGLLGIWRFEDLDENGRAVDLLDLLTLLGAWGPCDDFYNCPGDMSGDGAVDVNDLFLLLGAWG